MDKITICDLEVFYHVGVPQEERARPQRLLVTVEMERVFSSPIVEDDLSKTIDYEAVVQRLLHYGEGRSWKLIEKLAADVAEIILAEFKPRMVCVQIKKFIIPQARYVGVSVTRSPAVG